MGKISFRCSNCGHGLSADAAHTGKKCRCPRCSKVVPIPAASGAEGAGPASPAGSPDACPGCGKSVSPDQVICVNCGLNLKTGERVGSALEKAPPGQGAGEGPVRKRYSIRFARGKGGRGKRTVLGTPADVVLAPDEEDPERRIEFEGTRLVSGGLVRTLILTILATGATYWAARYLAQGIAPYAAASCVVWYLVFARMSRVAVTTSLYAKGSARAVCDDGKSWISVEVSPREWVSFVTVKGMMPRPDETDEKSYGIVRDTLGEMLGDGLEARR